MPKHYLVPENVINEFVSKVTKHGDKVTAILKSDTDTKSKRLENLNAEYQIIKIVYRLDLTITLRRRNERHNTPPKNKSKKVQPPKTVKKPAKPGKRTRDNSSSESDSKKPNFSNTSSESDSSVYSGEF